MRIGDSVYVFGYVDEIRRDVVIIRNSGGYFGTVPENIVSESPLTHCRECQYWGSVNDCSSLSEKGYQRCERLRIRMKPDEFCSMAIRRKKDAAD